MNKEFLSDLERASIIETAWLDKKGRESLPGSTLFVAIDSPRPDMKDLTESVFSALLEDPRGSLRWTKSWGKTVICIQPGGKKECVLADEREQKFKRFVPVSTSARVNPENFISGVIEGKAGKIVLNNQQVTIEALLISYIHMIDELILDHFLKRMNIGIWDSQLDCYLRAVKRVKDMKFSLSTGSTDEILRLKMVDPGVSVRIYGSGVNKSVPKVMGAAMVGGIND